MSNPYERIHKLEEEVERQRKQLSTVKKLSVAVIAVSLLAVVGVAFIIMNTVSIPTLALGMPDLPRFSLSSITGSNVVEEEQEEVIIGANPEYVDTDGDGITDYYENSIGTNPTLADTDMDGLRDGEEIERGTDPVNRNTDGDRYDDGFDMQPTIYNAAEITVTPYNLQTKRNTEDAIVIESLTGNRYLNPYTVLYTVQVDTDVKNIGTDYTSWVRYDVVFKIDSKEIGRISESILRIDAGATVTKHYVDEIRLLDLPQEVADKMAAKKEVEVSVEIQNILFERF